MMTYFARLSYCIVIAVAVSSTQILAEEMRTSGETARTVAESSKPQAGQIDQLIAQLGSARYVERKSAEQELLAIGLDAFDQVLAGTKNVDPEIASSCEYLLEQMTIHWERRDDSQLVRRLLQSYSLYSDSDRQQLLVGLAQLPGGDGTAALCRISRYDRSDDLSKLAALLVFQAEKFSPNLPPDAAAIIAAEIGDSPRPGAEWLRLFAQQLREGPKTIPAWRTAIDRAFQESSTSGQEDDSLSMNDARQANLLWNLLRLELTAGQKEPVEKTFARLVELRPESANQELTRGIDWIAEAENWPALERVLGQFEEQIVASKQGAYAVALARHVQGRNDLADQMAEIAFKQPSVAQRRFNGLDERVRTGELLMNRGLVDWGRRELRTVVEEQPVLSEPSIAARGFLFDSLVDREEYEEAVTLISALNEKIGESALNRRTFQTLLQQTDHWEVKRAQTSRNREAYARACAAREKGAAAEEIKHLEAAIAADPTDADAIIALYRVADASPELREKTLKLIDELSRDFQEQIEEDPENPTSYNQWAWLVSNTVGDYEKAVRYSERSLEIMPDDPGYLDTLGRCYFAAGDLQKAVETQRKAVAKMPNMQVMQRQLKQFEQALASQSRQKAEGSGQ